MSLHAVSKRIKEDTIDPRLSQSFYSDSFTEGSILAFRSIVDVADITVAGAGFGVRYGNT